MTAIDRSTVAIRAAEQAARVSYGKLLSILAARDRDIAAAEDALSEALVSALRVWPVEGVPDNPDAWLLTAARNRRKNEARARLVRVEAEPELIRRAEGAATDEPLRDKRLALMFVCAHPAISPAVRTPLILQTVLGIDAATIAKAFLIEPAAMSQSLVRAKARIRDTGLRFALPEASDLQPRLDAVLDAIYAAFSHGWDALDEGKDALTGEAIWLARLVAEQLPGEPEPKGLLALMLYCAARRAARRGADGRFIPLDQQDTRLWDRNQIIEAEGLLTAAARYGRFGRFQCEAAIQSVHIQRPITGRVNHAALRTLYDLLISQSDSIGARVGRAIVIAEAGQPAEAMAELDNLPRERVERYQPFWVARCRIGLLAGQPAIVAVALAAALALTQDPAVRRYLEAQYGRADLRMSSS